MKALTIRQPWISQLISGEKPAEYRSWPTSYRGLILLHAGSRPDNTAGRDLPRGVILAIAELVDVVRITAENQSSYSYDGEAAPIGQYAWIFDPIVPVDPVPAVGRLGLFEIPWSGETWSPRVASQLDLLAGS